MQTKGRAMYTTRQDQANGNRNRLRSWLILILVIAVAGFVVSTFLRRDDTRTAITYSVLPCNPEQEVVPFGSDVLYYDGTSINCCTAEGNKRWSFQVGEGASFSASDTHVIVWHGMQLHIIDANGYASFDDTMEAAVQFARVGSHYAAIVMGTDTKPILLVTDLKGAEIDYERDAFANMLMLDVGFYGDQGQYLWTMCMDVYGLKPNTVLNTLQVGKMNNGEVSLGEKLAYKVLFENKRLRVFTTQQLYTYDYKAVQDSSMTELIYGWQLIDSYIPARGDAYMLLTPDTQVSGTPAIRELRLISGNTDRRFALLGECIGAMVHGDSIYGFSSDNIYRTSVKEQRFYSYPMPFKGVRLTGYIGLCDDGHALLTDGNAVYSVAIPQ